jgi:hypothetical protein
VVQTILEPIEAKFSRLRKCPSWSSNNMTRRSTDEPRAKWNFLNGDPDGPAQEQRRQKPGCDHNFRSLVGDIWTASVSRNHRIVGPVFLGQKHRQFDSYRHITNGESIGRAIFKACDRGTDVGCRQ